jgi:glycosyltransferase involved in cell wall biosynthesis
MIQLSIISPVFNAKQFISLCIENILQQDYQHIEHIIVDGGSTDGTVDIIKQYASQYAHIRWISEKDQGQSDAMNKGIKMARGQFISFLNADDFYAPGVLKRVKDLLETQTFQIPAVLIGKLHVIGPAEEVIEVQFTEKLSLLNVLKYWKRNTYPGNPTCYFYHKKLHEIIGPYAIDDHFTMDYVFFIKASRVAHFYYFDEIWGNYRLIPGTKTFENNAEGKSRQMKESIFHQYKRKLFFFDYLRINYEYVVFKSQVKKGEKLSSQQKLRRVIKNIMKAL